MIFSVLRYPLTVQGDTLGSPVTLTVPIRGRSLTVRYRCGNREGVLAKGNTDGVVHWTPPLSLAREYPEDNRIPVELTLEEERKGVRISARREQLLLKLPEEITPQVALRYTDALGYHQVYGGFVQGKSQLSLGVQAAGTFGSGIRWAELSCGGLAGTGSDLIFDLPQAGEVALTAQVWDDRGRVGQANGTVTVLPYGSPTGEILAVAQGEICTVDFRGRVTELGGKNQGNFTLLLEKGEETQRFPVAQGWEEAGQVELPDWEDGCRLALEVRDDFETVVIPYVAAPLLDVAPETRALGVGCRADRPSAVRLGLPLDLGGNPVENLSPPEKAGDAVSLGYADSTYWHPRLLWENPEPSQGFPAQTLDVAGDFLLIEAAVEAGETAAFWEFGKEQGQLRTGSGVTRSFRQTQEGLVFDTTDKGDSWAVPLRVFG